MKDANRDPPVPGFNRGGRPRKDGSKADNSVTFKDWGISKREATRMRRLGSLSEDDFEVVITQWRANWDKGGPKRSIESFLPDHLDNSRHERETTANIARIISTAKAIAKTHEFDASHKGEALRKFAELTTKLWLTIKECDEDSRS